MFPTMAKTKSSTPTKPTGKRTNLTTVLFVRVPPSMVEAVDALVEREKQLRPGMLPTRADVLRELLRKALGLRAIES
jgi:hypothetical protein